MLTYLNDQVLEEFFVLNLLPLLHLDELDLSVLVEVLSEAVDRLHSLNAFAIFGGAPLDFELDFIFLELFNILGLNPLLLLFDELRLELFEVLICLLDDYTRLFLALRDDVFDHLFAALLGHLVPAVHPPLLSLNYNLKIY